METEYDAKYTKIGNQLQDSRIVKKVVHREKLQLILQLTFHIAILTFKMYGYMSK